MGKGEEVKTRPDPDVEIQERGDIFFFYRPKVNKEEAHSVDDVQRLYIVLHPESGNRNVEEKQSPDSGKEGKKIAEEHKDEKDDGEKKVADNDDDNNQRGKEGGHGSEEINIENQSLFRLIVMGRKSLPDPSQRSRPYWGFVQMVTTKADDILVALKGEEYDTATHGRRHQSPARALTEGVYCILKHQAGNRKAHTHLVYKLELPPTSAENEPQESLNIEREASFIIKIKNPGQGGSSGRFTGLQTKRKALFPASLQSRLGHLRFAPADPPDFLNYEGCEFLMISASDDLEELGLELKVEVEETQADESCSDLIHMFGEASSSKPLLRGTWV